MNPTVACHLEPSCELVRAELGELPGLRLTAAQARRLSGLDEWTCGRVLQTLVDAHFLVRTDNQFCRADQIDGAASID